MTLIWRRSSRCDSGCCVLVAADPARRVVWVRDSKLGATSPELAFSFAEWERHVLAPVEVEELPINAFQADPRYRPGQDSVIVWAGRTGGGALAALIFDLAEWDAFASDVMAGRYAIATLMEGVTSRG